jgi:hypothetical protein
MAICAKTGRELKAKVPTSCGKYYPLQVDLRDKRSLVDICYDLHPTICKHINAQRNAIWSSVCGEHQAVAWIAVLRQLSNKPVALLGQIWLDPGI